MDPAEARCQDTWVLLWPDDSNPQRHKPASLLPCGACLRVVRARCLWENRGGCRLSQESSCAGSEPSIQGVSPVVYRVMPRLVDPPGPCQLCVAVRRVARCWGMSMPPAEVLLDRPTLTVRPHSCKRLCCAANVLACGPGSAAWKGQRLSWWEYISMPYQYVIPPESRSRPCEKDSCCGNEICSCVLR